MSDTSPRSLLLEQNRLRKAVGLPLHAVPKQDEVDVFLSTLKGMTSTQRVEVFHRLSEVYCKDCGEPQPVGYRRCQCMNDE